MAVEIDQAFTQAFIDGAFGLPVAHENLPFTPASDPYAEIFLRDNDRTAFSLNDSDETDGIFRVILRYPSGTGAIVAKQKADEINAAFKIGTVVCFDGVCATTTGQSRSQGVPETGWFKLVLTFRYKAFLRR